MPGTSDWTQFTGWIIISLAIILTAAGGYNALKFPAWKRLEVPFRDLHPDLEGFRIVHLSDLHLGLFRGSAFLAAVVDEVNRQAPDFVVITGDLSDGSVENLGNEVLPLRDLQGPTLFVTGNHDYYWGADSWVRHLEGLGVQMLLDSSEVFIKGEARLLVVGVSDPTIKTFSPEIPTGLAVATPNPGEADLKLLLAHRPAMGFQAEEFGFDLQLSGHTHGGQFFPWNYVIHLVQPFATGLHRYRKMWIYCSRGTGFWGPPIRLGAPAEITEIRLVQG
jgi:predicted MPP superfamily phosphohydrolase